MSRKIKFRGRWQTTSGKYEWEYGVPYTSWEGQTAILYQSVRGDTDYFRALSMSAREVDPSTIGQFTGLYDRNGSEIYDGDIIFSRLNNVVVVKYGYKEHIVKHGRFTDSISGYGWIVENIQNRLTDFLDNDFIGGEVIGNIYDNPELVEL
ncbi:MAG: YopX family protein [Bacteroides sp.]|nr:YopX family protein [Bacteroides sp.]